jgi:hypothetical protein
VEPRIHLIFDFRERLRPHQMSVCYGIVPHILELLCNTRIFAKRGTEVVIASNTLAFITTPSLNAGVTLAWSAVMPFCVTSLDVRDEVNVGNNVYLIRPEKFDQLRALVRRRLSKLPGHV